MKRVCDVVRDLIVDDKLHELVLRVQNDVSQLAEVVNHHLGLVVFEEEDLAGKALEDSVVIKELIQDGVKDALKVTLGLCEPGLARKTQRWVIIVKDLEHVLQCYVASVIVAVFV